MSMKNDKQPCARLCHIVKWEDFDGYGFNLHAERGKEGQFIGKVDDGSPSQAAGLRQGDRIIEVNEINIDNETHKQVVDRIKAFPNETKLLVVDQEADDYYKANNIIIKGTMSGIKVIKTPEKNPSSEHEAPEGSISSVEDNTHKSNNSNDTLSNSGSTATMTATSINDSNLKEKINNNGQQENGRSDIYNNEKSISNEIGNNSTEHLTTGNGNISTTKESLNLKMSVKEFRAKLAASKKYDPKKESNLGFEDKFNIVKDL